MQHAHPQGNGAQSAPWRSAGLIAVRYGIGAGIMLAGVVSLVAVGGELGTYGFASAIGAGLSVLLLNLLFRMSVSGERDREREEEARRYFDAHGVWPDDEPERVSGHKLILPRGAVTAEQEECERRFAAGGGIPRAVS